MNCNCENEENPLGSIALQNCPFDLKQIQRMAFVISGEVVWDSATGGGAGTGVPQNNSQLDTKADWDARTTDKTVKGIIITPKIGGEPKIEAGDPITKGGGGNDTFNGVKRLEGFQNAVFSTKFYSISPKVEKGLKQFNCRVDVEVYFFTQGGFVVAKKAEDKEEIRGFKVLAYAFSDRTNEGYGASDYNTMTFELEAGYSEDLVKIKPADFHAVNDLIEG